MNPGGQKIFKLMAPPPAGQNYYMMSMGEYADTEASMGLLPVAWNEDTHLGEDFDPVESCVGSTTARIDTECQFGNTCARIFIDYAGTAGCYPATGQRCANDGAPCGHKLIEEFQMCVGHRAAAPPSC